MTKEYKEELDKKLSVLEKEINEKRDLIYKEKLRIDELNQDYAEIVNRKTYLAYIEENGLYGRIVGDYLQRRGHGFCGYGNYYILIDEKTYLHGRLTINSNGEYFFQEKQYELDAHTMWRFFDKDFAIDNLEKWKDTVIAYEKGEKVEYEDINGEGLLKFKY